MKKQSSFSINQLFQWIAHHELIVLLLIIGLAFFVRLYRIDNPIADWHSFRQADTASVTREYVKHGVDMLHPRYHDLSNIQAGTRVGGADNVEGWRMVEFPFVNALIATTVRTFPFLPEIITYRMFSIFASLGTLLCLYLFVKEKSHQAVAQLTGLTFALLPYSVFYSRVILPEPFMLFFSMFSLLSFGYWLQTKKWYWYLGSAISLSLAVLLKPFVVFLAPVYVTLFLSSMIKEATIKQFFTRTILHTLLLIPYLLVAFVPFFLWREWITQFPSGIPASDWLFNSNGIRFRPAWFRWLGYERMVKLFLGYFGAIFMVTAFLPVLTLISNFQKTISNSKLKKSAVKNGIWNLEFGNLSLVIGNWKLEILLLSWWLGMLAYVSVFATGNVQHDYYQNLLLPIISLTIATGVYNLFIFLKNRNEYWKLEIGNCKFKPVELSLFIVTICYLGMLIMSWQQIKGYFNVNHWEYVETGKFVDKMLPNDAKIIAPAMGDTVFLFQTNRTGWPIGFDIDTKIKNGAQYYVTTSYDDEARELEAKYPTLSKTEKYLLLDLSAPAQN